MIDFKLVKKVTFCIFSHHGHAPHNARIIPSRLEMGYQKSILFAEMGKWYDKKVTQSRIVNVDCIIRTSRVKMVYFCLFFNSQKWNCQSSDKHVYKIVHACYHAL